MGVIMSKEFHRALDVDGSMKGKAWDFVMKLGRDADLTGLDLKMPKGATDRRVRTARVDDNFRAVLFAVGDEKQPDVAARGDQAARRRLPARRDPDAHGQPRQRGDGGAGDRGRPGEGRRLPQAPVPTTTAPSVLPFPVADLVALGLDAEVVAEAVRQTDQDDGPRAGRRPAGVAAAGVARPHDRHVARRRPLHLRSGRTHLGRRPGRGGCPPDEPHAVRLPRQRRRAAPDDGGRLRRVADLPAPDTAGGRPPRDLQRALPTGRGSGHRQDRRRPAPRRVPRPPARCSDPALHLHPQPRGEPGGRPALLGDAGAGGPGGGARGRPGRARRGRRASTGHPARPWATGSRRRSGRRRCASSACAARPRHAAHAELPRSGVPHRRARDVRAHPRASTCG